MQRFVTLERMGQILARAVHQGAVRTGRLAHRWSWAVHGNCTRPVDVRLVARTEYKGNGPLFFRVHPVEAKTVMLDLTTRCRKCDECRAAKSAHWRFRAEAEISAWPRTWLGTLTLRPEMHYQMKLRAAAYLDRNGLRFEDMDTAEQFQLRCAEIGKEITLWQKRFRIAAGGKYRMLTVFERHDGKRGVPGAVYGMPHVHVLVHECNPLQPVRKRVLQEKWRLGFTNFKLVPPDDPGKGSYVCKYIAKDMLSRVRASQEYGLNRATLLEPSLENIVF